MPLDDSLWMLMGNSTFIVTSAVVMAAGKSCSSMSYSSLLIVVFRLISQVSLNLLEKMINNSWRPRVR